MCVTPPLPHTTSVVRVGAGLAVAFGVVRGACVGVRVAVGLVDVRVLADAFVGAAVAGAVRRGAGDVGDDCAAAAGDVAAAVGTAGLAEPWTTAPEEPLLHAAAPSISPTTAVMTRFVPTTRHHGARARSVQSPAARGARVSGRRGS